MFAHQFRLGMRVMPGPLGGTRQRPGRHWKRLLFAGAAVLAGTAAMSQPALAAAAAPSATFTSLTLLNGWTGYGGTASPAVADIAGIVTFKGAISTSSSNTNNVAFVLPPLFRPGKYVNLPVDMCDATTGELNIAPNGTTQVITSGANSNATCFTSLDGASFALSTKSLKSLKLRPGWTNAADSGRKATVTVAGGLIRLAGEVIATGKGKVVLTLPAAFRPAANVYVPINLCTGSMGLLQIKSDGVVSVQPPGTGNWWMAKCGVSLEGASFALSSKSFTALPLRHGWKNAPDKTAKAAARVIAGIVHFRGAIWTRGTSAAPFVLPAGLRPGSDVYITVGMCDGNTGRLNIQPDGVVSVEPQSGGWSQAQCRTSLDGASFAR
jgi:hypothetical protein